MKHPAFGPQFGATTNQTLQLTMSSYLLACTMSKKRIKGTLHLVGAAPLGHCVGYQKSTVQGNSTKACIIAPKWVQTMFEIISTPLATMLPKLHPFHLSGFFN